MAFRTPADGGPSLLLASKRCEGGGGNSPGAVRGSLDAAPGVILAGNGNCGGGCQTPEAFRPADGTLPWVLPVGNDCTINDDVRLPVVTAPQLWI